MEFSQYANVKELFFAYLGVEIYSPASGGGQNQRFNSDLTITELDLLQGKP